MTGSWRRNGSVTGAGRKREACAVTALRRVHEGGLGGGGTGNNRTPVAFRIEAAHPHVALMAPDPGGHLDAPRELELRHALLERLAGNAHHVVAELCRLAQDRDLEGRFDGADGLDHRRNVDDLPRLQGLHVARVLVEGQDVELHAQALDLLVALVGKHAGKLPGAPRIEEMLEKGFRTDAVGVLADEEDGVPVEGDEQPALGNGAGEVEKIGVLDDERPVDLRRGQLQLQGLDPAVQFLLRRFVHCFYSVKAGFGFRASGFRINGRGLFPLTLTLSHRGRGIKRL